MEAAHSKKESFKAPQESLGKESLECTDPLLPVACGTRAYETRAWGHVLEIVELYKQFVYRASWMNSTVALEVTPHSSGVIPVATFVIPVATFVIPVATFIIPVANNMHS